MNRPNNSPPRSLNPSVLNKFIAPPEYQNTVVSYGRRASNTTPAKIGHGGTLAPSTAPSMTTGTMGSAPGGGTMGSSFFRPPKNKNALDQVPPIERGELPLFQTVARGTSNPLAHLGTVEQAAEQAPQNQRIRTSLDQIWLKGQFAKAPQVQDVDPAVLKATWDPKVSATTKVLHLVPERFERGAVRRPFLAVEEVDTELVFGDPSAVVDESGREGKIQNPALRRWAHDTAVNARQGKQALKEALMARNKMIKTCRFNHPHGALGCAESPYNPPDASNLVNGEGGKVYETGSRLERETKLAARRSKGGPKPMGTLGGLLKGLPPAAGDVQRAGGKKVVESAKSTFTLQAMAGSPKK